MSTIYVNIGGGGPWALADTAIVMGGRLVAAVVVNGPTVGGIDISGRTREVRSLGGMVRGHEGGFTHGRDSHRRQQ